MKAAEKNLEKSEKGAKQISEENKLEKRMDFFVMPKKEDEKSLRQGNMHKCYWDKVSLVHFIRDMIYEDRPEASRLAHYAHHCCNLYNENQYFTQRFKNWLNLYFRVDLRSTLMLISGHFLLTVLPTFTTIHLLNNERFPSLVMEKLVLYPYTSFLQPILLSSYKFPMFVYGLYSMNLPFIIMPVLFYSNNPMIISASRFYQIVVSPIFMGCTALVCYSWPYLKRMQNNKFHRKVLEN